MRKPDISSGTLVKAEPSTSSRLAAFAGTALNRKREASKMSERMRAVLSSEEAGQKSRLVPHRRAIFGIGHEHALFRPDTRGQNKRIRQRGDDRGNPRCMNEGKRDHFQDHSGVIRLAHKAKRPGSHDADSRRIYHLYAPHVSHCSSDAEARYVR